MLVPLQVTFRHVDDKELEAVVRRHVAKLEQFCSDIVSCRVLVERSGKRRYGNPYHVRIDLGVPDEELVVEHEPSLHASLADAAAEKTEKSDEAGNLQKNPRRAVDDAFSAMRRRLQDYVRRRRREVKTHTENALHGIVSSLFPEDGYGFLMTTDDRQVYFHQASVLDDHFNLLRVGSEVRFMEEVGDKGPQASTVRLTQPRKQARAVMGPSVGAGQGR